MADVLEPVSIPGEPLDRISEHQLWHMKIKQLLREAEYAKEKGQWGKAQRLLFEVTQISRNLHR
jgi:hypothetical protein